MAQCDNVALGKPATASNSIACCIPQYGVDGDCGLIWNAGNYAVQYIQVDLLATYTVNNINIMFEMSPNGNVNHEILTSPDMITWSVVDVVTGFYVTGQLVERCYSSSPLTNVRGVRINTTSSPSWIAIREMGVYTVSTPAIPTITASGPLTFCQGQSVTLTSSAAYSYLWSTGETTQSITVSSSNTYSVTTDQTPACTKGTVACTTCGVGTASTVVTVNPLPVISVTPANSSICIGDSQVLTASGANTYSWSPSTDLSAGAGASVTATPLLNSSYTVTGTDALGCVNTTPVSITVSQKPLVNVSAGGNPQCDSSKFNWGSWSSVTATTGNGTISSDLSITVTKPTGGLSTTAGMYNGGVFPAQYDVPANNTAIRNDLAGLFTFCFNRPVINPQIALSSIGNGGNSVQINTSNPYVVIWNGIGMSYPNNTTFVGTEGFTIIQFPGVHTCISFDYLQSESYCNLAFGTLDTNCQAQTPPPMCAGNSDTLTASGALSYTWSPAGGLNTTTGAVVIATPTVTTTYTVTGTNASNCTDIDSILISVSTNSANASIVGDTSICLGDSTTLTASGGATYLWMPGGSTNAVLTVGPLIPTTYTVTVTNTGGCKDSAIVTVNVNALPQAQFNLTAVCKTQPMAFNDVSTGAISSRTWYYGDGSMSTLQNSTHIYAACDTFNVKLIVSTAAGCKDSITKTATVHCLPLADFSFTNVCKGLVMDFTDLSVATDDSVTQWSWNFGDNSALSVIKNASHTYSSAGAPAVSLIVTSNNGCKDTVSKNVIIYPLPNAKFNTANVCDGAVMSFNDVSTISSPSTIQSRTWDFGDGSPVSSNQNTSHTYALPGSYSVELLVESVFGCVDSITKTVKVHSNPVVSFTATDSTGCAPLCISFQGQSSVSGGTAALWSWNVGDGTALSSSQNFDHCYANASAVNTADYTVSLTVTSDSGCVTTSTNNNYIRVYPVPHADFSVDPSSTTITNPVITIDEASAGADMWAWDFGDMDTSFIHNPAPHTYADTGTYRIDLFIANQYGCVDSTNRTIVIKPQFVFYIPNSFTPNNDFYNKTFSGKGMYIIEYEMMIFDRWGNLLYLTDDLEKPWDGTINGGKEIALQDTYVYSIKIKDIKKDQHYYRGTVSLIR